MENHHSGVKERGTLKCSRETVPHANFGSGSCKRGSVGEEKERSHTQLGMIVVKFHLPDRVWHDLSTGLALCDRGGILPFSNLGKEFLQ